LKFLLLLGGSMVCENSPRCMFHVFDAEQFMSTSPAQGETAGHTYAFNVGVS
jgi:hypothetical protein